MELKLFYKPGCPYCIRAEKIITKMIKDHPAYEQVQIQRINEAADQALANQHDYWYVPSVFLGKEKLYEADPGESAEEVKAKLERVFQKALAR